MAIAESESKPKRKTVQEVLRDRLIAARNSGKSVNQIAGESGVSQPILSRWISGTDKESISGPTVDKLAKYFGLELQ